jgi:hypothetical protein
LWFYGQGCWHPHIHALVAEGVFLPDGGFLALPKLATEPFLKLWEQAVFDLLLAEGKIPNGGRGRREWRIDSRARSQDRAQALGGIDQAGV